MDSTAIVAEASDPMAWKMFYLVVSGMATAGVAMAAYIVHLHRRSLRKEGEYIRLVAEESAANRTALQNNTEAWKDNAQSNRELMLTLAKRRK